MNEASIFYEDRDHDLNFGDRVHALAIVSCDLKFHSTIFSGTREWVNHEMTSSED